ncbi:MAG: hypothetical protein IPQ07_27575 [Myxococcales bacterium]|nr:hypothetical protein [Myxococcales bacterium]
MTRFPARSATWLATAATAALLLGTTACAGDDSTDEDAEDGFVIEDGKADDFLSVKAREFIVSGTARVVVEEGQGEARAKKLIMLKHVATTWFLNQYLVDKETGPHGDVNADYGGFAAMVKDGAYQDLNLRQINGTTWEFKFEQVIAGKKNLMSKLPLDAHGAFSIEVGKPTNAEMEHDKEWYRKAPWDGWNPATVPAAQKETLTLSVREEKKTTDGWWDYARLFEDGKLTVDVHFGYDYNPEKAHLVDSKAFYTWLTGRGFRSPVSTWDKYSRTSGPLTKTIDANGKNVKVEVRIFYPRPGTSTDPETDAGGKQLERDMFGSLADRDVIVYSGHSGSLYGFALSNWDKTDEGDVDDVELATAQLARDRYQIVFAEGCNTYMLGNTLMQNPNKAGKNIDVITTTSFSVSYSPVQDFLGRMLELDSQGRLRPRTMSQTIEDLDLYSVGEPSPTMYGIHGINDNPKLHPFANPENACKSCSSNAACGGVGNSCVSVGTSGRRCVAACTDDSGCGTGYKCKPVASASSAAIYGNYCVPETRRCD